MALFGKNTNEILVLSPVDGKVKDLKKVDDAVFAGEMVGKGVAVTPTGSTFNSPFDGAVKVAFPTGHAYGIAHKQGPEVLVHIGLDTVTLGGEGFTAKTEAGKKIKAGQILADTDLEFLKKNAKSTDTIVVITNETFGEFKMTDIAKGAVKAGDVLFRLVK